MTKLLVSTHQALVLWEDGKEKVLHSGMGSYFGITWSHDRLYVVARGNHPSRLLAFTPTMQLVESPPYSHMGENDDGPHQAFWWDGTLYVTNTQRNRVEIWRGGDEIEYLAWNETGKDTDHINSIWRDPDTGYFYVVEHRWQQRPKRIRVLSADLDLLDTIDIDLDCLADGPTHSGLHNIYKENERLMTLGPSQVVLTDETSRAVNLPGVVANKHYLRGLARSNSHYFVGVSAAVPRGERHYGASRILMLDDDLTIVDEFQLSRRFGQLTDLRVIGEPDRAHNGVPCSLETVQGDTSSIFTDSVIVHQVHISKQEKFPKSLVEKGEKLILVDLERKIVAMTLFEDYNDASELPLYHSTMADGLNWTQAEHDAAVRTRIIVPPDKRRRYIFASVHTGMGKLPGPSGPDAEADRRAAKRFKQAAQLMLAAGLPGDLSVVWEIVGGSTFDSGSLESWKCGANC